MTTLLTGAEPFHHGDRPLDFTAADFWRWAFSSLAGNAVRGILAEYLVARALDCAAAPRVEWDAVDVRTSDGLLVEVKCSGYIQTWPQAKPSTVSFDIGARRAWDAATNLLSASSGRCADVYVFCVHAHRDRASLDPLDVAQWEFLVLSRVILDAQLPSQKRAGRSAIERLGALSCRYEQLGATVRASGRRA